MEIYILMCDIYEDIGIHQETLGVYSDKFIIENAKLQYLIDRPFIDESDLSILTCKMNENLWD